MVLSCRISCGFAALICYLLHRGNSQLPTSACALTDSGSSAHIAPYTHKRSPALGTASHTLPLPRLSFFALPHRAGFLCPTCLAPVTLGLSTACAASFTPGAASSCSGSPDQTHLLTKRLGYCGLPAARMPHASPPRTGITGFISSCCSLHAFPHAAPHYTPARTCAHCATVVLTAAQARLCRMNTWFCLSAGYAVHADHLCAAWVPHLLRTILAPAGFMITALAAPTPRAPAHAPRALFACCRRALAHSRHVGLRGAAPHTPATFFAASISCAHAAHLATIPLCPLPGLVRKCARTDDPLRITCLRADTSHAAASFTPSTQCVPDTARAPLAFLCCTFTFYAGPLLFSLHVLFLASFFLGWTSLHYSSHACTPRTCMRTAISSALTAPLSYTSFSARLVLITASLPHLCMPLHAFSRLSLHCTLRYSHLRFARIGYHGSGLPAHHTTGSTHHTSLLSG